ncbi:MAG: class I SAM-dependent methyltransferase [Lachnospiraceae bacterium]|nr:class I SAM-dependent methyltransferase [Lachnospiraceae bacterium]
MCNTDEERWNIARKTMIKSDFILGEYLKHAMLSDIKHLGFSLSRYKFAAKMLMYKPLLRVCELGCSEAIGGVMLKQNTQLLRYVGIDLDKEAIKWNRENLSDEEFVFINGNFLDEKCTEERFDAVISLDVIEHIKPDNEDLFCKRMVDKLEDEGVAIIGTPNVSMRPYANESARIVHINNYDQQRLYETMTKYFRNVFIFGMNDEIVNTGFEPMACYLFAICTGRRIIY